MWNITPSFAFSACPKTSGPPCDITMSTATSLGLWMTRPARCLLCPLRLPQLLPCVRPLASMWKVWQSLSSSGKLKPSCCTGGCSCAFGELLSVWTAALLTPDYTRQKNEYLQFDKVWETLNNFWWIPDGKPLDASHVRLGAASVPSWDDGGGLSPW